MRGREIIDGCVRCSNCKEDKPVENFSKGDSPLGLSYYCKDCASATYMKKNPVKENEIVSLEGEIWKGVPSLDGVCLCSNFGRIKKRADTTVKANGGVRRNPSKIVKQVINPWGYMYINISVGGIPYKLFSHRVIAEAFIPNPENKPFINHIDRNRSNNNIENLEWCTSRENQHHRTLGENNSSKYVGVKKHKNRWLSRIWIEGKSRALGTYKTEVEAHNAFQVALKNWQELGQMPEHKRPNKHTKYTGLIGNGTGGFSASFTIDKVTRYVGFFKDQELGHYWLEAAKEDYKQTGTYIKYRKGDTVYNNTDKL